MGPTLAPGPTGVYKTGSTRQSPPLFGCSSSLLFCLFPRRLPRSSLSSLPADRSMLAEARVKTLASPATNMTGAAGDGCGEHYSRLIRELCALLFTIVSPSPAPGRPAPGISPAAAASMLLGASMALMLCGSVTFAIGLLLMPWVAGIALLFGFAGAVSTLSSGFFGKAAALPYKDAPRGRICSPIGSDVLVA